MVESGDILECSLVLDIEVEEELSEEDVEYAEGEGAGAEARIWSRPWMTGRASWHKSACLVRKLSSWSKQVTAAVPWLWLW